MTTPSHDVIHYLRSLLHHPSDAAANDRELLRRFVDRNDEAAFAALLRRHGAMVLNLARRITGDQQLAEDVFQATFLLLSQKGGSIRRPEALPCWLHGVARRLAIQARAGRLRRQRQEGADCPSSPSNPLDELTAQEFLAILDEELAKLPERYRAPLLLCCLEGLSQEEAARRLGCSAGALRGRLERGRQRLRMRLEKRGLTLPAVLGGTLLFAGATSPVPAVLEQATLQTAMRGDHAAPAIAALIQEATRSMFFHKLKAIGAAVVLLALAGTGVGMMSLRPRVAQEKALAAEADDKPLSAKKHVDLYGDPLPNGAVMRLGTVQRRAVGMNLAVTADGKSIIGARDCLCLNIWDAATGELRQKRELPEPWGTSMLSPDGRWLAQSHNALAIWDVRTIEKVRVLGAEEKRSFWPIAFSRDGKRVAAIGNRQDKKGNHDHLICAWNLTDGKEIFRTEFRLNRHSSQLAFSPDGKRLLASFASNTSEKGLYCWDIAAERQAWVNEDAFSFQSLVFTADGKILTSPWGQTVDLATGRTIELRNPPPITDKRGVVYLDQHLAMTPDGRTLLIPKPEGVMVWDMVHGKQRRMLQGAGQEIVVMPDGKSILTNNGSLQRWDLQTGQPLWQDTFALGHVGKVNAVAFSADGKRLASTSIDGSVRLWDAATGQPLRVWRAFRPQRYSFDFTHTLDISPDGRWVLAAGSHEPIKLWDASSEKEVRTIAPPVYDWLREHDLSVYHLRFRADGSQAVALYGAMTTPPIRHKLAAWDLKTGQMLASHTVEQSLPQSSALSPDGELLLHKGNLVNTASGHKIARLEGPLSWPCAFSRDGALVLGVRQVPAEYSFRVWESATGKTVAHVKPNLYAHQVAFHPNNRLLAADGDGVQLHDAVTGKRVAIRRMPNDVMRNEISFAFTPDGRRLATGMPDGTILLWDLSLPSPPPQRLQAKEIESLWADLADADAVKAWRAVWRLADAPHDALAFLRRRVKPCPIAATDLTRKLLSDLDSASFADREAAVNRLKELGAQAEPALRSALAAKPSLEQRRRIEELLAAVPLPLTPEELRQLRALIVLERIGMPEARRVLEEVAKGPPSARQTRQARAALVYSP